MHSTKYDFVQIVIFCILILIANLRPITCGNKILSLLDKLCFRFYLWQQFCIEIVRNTIRFDTGWNVCVVFALDITIAVLTYQIGEKISRKINIWKTEEE